MTRKKTDKEKKREYLRKYRQKNREKYLEYQRRYRELNHEKRLEYDRKYRELNHEKILEYKRKYYRKKKNSNSETIQTQIIFSQKVDDFLKLLLIHNTKENVYLTGVAVTSEPNFGKFLETVSNFWFQKLSMQILTTKTFDKNFLIARINFLRDLQKILFDSTNLDTKVDDLNVIFDVEKLPLKAQSIEVQNFK